MLDSLAQKIHLQNVRVHNLKSLSIELAPNRLICFTGVSGSGKTSLAFDTIYVEGQRRYVESLPQHVRRFLGELPKPDLDFASGLTPTISIEQKTVGKKPSLDCWHDYRNLRLLARAMGPSWHRTLPCKW